MNDESYKEFLENLTVFLAETEKRISRFGTSLAIDKSQIDLIETLSRTAGLEFRYGRFSESDDYFELEKDYFGFSRIARSSNIANSIDDTDKGVQ